MATRKRTASAQLARSRRSTSWTEREAERLADAILAELYPASTPIARAAERTRWIWLDGRKVPRNTGEDLFGCLDRLVVTPQGLLHGIQVTTAANAAARKRKVKERLLDPICTARAALDAGELAELRIDVWALFAGLAMRGWRWSFRLGQWCEITDGALSTPINRRAWRLVAAAGYRLRLRLDLDARSTDVA